MFAPSKISRGSAVDACVRSLRAAIVRGELPRGALLPPERALAERFGVNRTTLRSALARLGSERLVTTKQGSGHRVRDWRREAGPELLGELLSLSTGKTRLTVIADLLLVRRQLARAVLERLAERGDEHDVAAVTEAVERFAKVVDEGGDATARFHADAAVLGALVAASKSAVLSLCLNPVLALAAAVPGLADAVYADARASVTAYRAVLAWMARPVPASLQLVDSIVAVLAARDEATLNRLRELSPSALRRVMQPRTSAEGVE
jgi:DNA-binding FadR family transcriptional regulator